MAAGAAVTLVAAAAALAIGLGSAAAAKGACATIQSGLIHDSTGNALTTGYDRYGYNYQGHEFNGTYDGVDRVLDGKYFGTSAPWVSDSLQMKWSNDWLSNTDCNGDGLLDRGAGGVSQGWETNHASGTYVDANGDTQRYEDFAKIAWVGPGGDLWGQYTVLQEVYNDTGGGSFRTKAAAPGLGLNDGWTVAP
ncbi:MAG TPA: hypothetical protein VFJ77_11195 [Gaiellaceae bacterium]|nr:hypothetical protein [Gaiellaceae bacterium]